MSVSFRPLPERAHCRPGTEPGTEGERRDWRRKRGAEAAGKEGPGRWQA